MSQPKGSQVEADATVVTTNQRFPIFFQEKRPFFLEGIDIFQLPLNVVHTRTIIDPDIAVKYAGKSGRNSFGIRLYFRAGWRVARSMSWRWPVSATGKRREQW